MKTKQEQIKQKYNKKLENKSKVGKTIVKPLYSILASFEYVFTGKDKYQPKTTSTQKIVEKKIEKTIELTSEVNIDSLGIFDNVVNESKKDLEKNLHTNSLSTNSKDFDSHSYLQAIKSREDYKNSSSYKENQEENARLEKIKERLIKKSGKKYTEEDLKLDYDIKQKHFADAGFISPTRGVIKPKVEEKEEETKEKETKEEVINREKTIEFTGDILTAEDAHDYLSIDEIAREINETRRFNTSPEATIEQIVQQALILDDNQDLESISDILIEDLTSDGTTLQEISKEIDNLSNEQIQRTIELQLAINSSDTLEEAQTKTNYTINQEDINPTNTTEKEVVLSDIPVSEFIQNNKEELTKEKAGPQKPVSPPKVQEVEEENKKPVD